MKIGVFDSGLGGEAVAEELRRLLPDAQVMSINDRAHMPYGTKPRAEIMKLTKEAIQPLLALECDTIVDEFAKDITVIEPDCSTWAELIETKQIEQINLKETINPLLEQGVDVIILGCTHYHWLKEAIEMLAGPGVTVLEPSDAIKNRILEITN